MRINTIDPGYIMIESSELTPTALLRDNFYAVLVAEKIFDYQRETGDIITEFAVKRANVPKKYINEIQYLTLNNYQNALIHAITHDCDAQILNSLQELVKSREILTFKAIEELYGENVSNYILRNGDYNYSEGRNENEKRDSSFVLYDNGNVMRIDLMDKKNPPVLQNPDVK